METSDRIVKISADYMDFKLKDLLESYKKDSLDEATIRQIQRDIRSMAASVTVQYVKDGYITIDYDEGEAILLLSKRFKELSAIEKMRLLTESVCELTEMCSKNIQEALSKK